MYSIITEQDFINAFRDAGRMKTAGGDGGNFSHEGLCDLYWYLEELDGDHPEFGVELDVMGVCTKFGEYESATEAMQATDPDGVLELKRQVHNHHWLDDDFVESICMEWLKESTRVLELPSGGVVIDEEY